MADLDKARENPQEQLWEALQAAPAGMLGIEGSGQHMQPMAPHADRDGKSIWFFTHRDSDLVRAAGPGSRAHFCVISKNHDYHACLAGELRENTDTGVVDRYWSPMVAAWYAKGREDPDVTLLQMRLEDAAIWASSGSSLRFGWQIAKANMTESEPDVGVRNHFRFAA